MTQQRVRYVDLLFENVESARLDPSMFSGLRIEHVAKSYNVNCWQYKHGEASVVLSCSYFAVTVNEKGLDKARLSGPPDPGTLRDRLRHRDITHVCLRFDDGSDECIGVPWLGGQFTNKAQKHKRSGKQIEIRIGAVARELEAR